MADVDFIQQQSSPTRSTTFAMGQVDSRLSSGSIDGGQPPGIVGIAATGGGGGGGLTMQSSSATSAAATPSWVLPKKTPPATVAGSSPIPAYRDIVGGGGDGTGLTGRFRGVSLTDPGFNSAGRTSL